MADISVWQPKFHLGGRKSTATLTTGDDGSTEDISSDMVEGGGEDATFLLSVAPPELMRVESSGSDESATDIAPSRSSQNEGDAGESAVVGGLLRAYAQMYDGIGSKPSEDEL